MGWLKLNRAKQQEQDQTNDDNFQFPTAIESLKSTTEHIERLDLSDDVKPLNTVQKYPFVPETVPDSDLPFVSTSEVSKRKAESLELWIVVNNIVYDCSQFVLEHPGGTDVIESFRGEDCSWQFWRFHGQNHMEEFGRPLRVARTEGVRNRFKEPVRYVGLRGIGQDDW
jgi:cytochrome b involved in lipid metabolism